MKTVIEPTFLPSDFSESNNCVYVYQSNFPALKEITFNPTAYKFNCNTAYTVSVFTVKPATTTIEARLSAKGITSLSPVMQVNEAGVLTF